jgi:hypothetical protein
VGWGRAEGAMQRSNSFTGGAPPVTQSAAPVQQLCLDASDLCDDPLTREISSRDDLVPDLTEGGGGGGRGGSGGRSGGVDYCELAGTDADAPRSLVGATRPRKDLSAVALQAGFEVYGVCRGVDDTRLRKRTQLLFVLQSRAVVYAEAEAGAAALRELVLDFFEGGGYTGAGYTALRAHAQRRLAALVQSALESSIGPLAVVESGQPLLVPLSRRLAKKLGDLLQLVFLLFDWQPSSSSLRGSAHAHGSGHVSDFALEMQATLQAFSHGLVFDPSHADGGSAALTARRSSSTASASTPPRSRDGANGRGGRGQASSSSSSQAAVQSSGYDDVAEAGGLRTLQTMRLLTAATHRYFGSLVGATEGGGGESKPFCSALRERLALALMRQAQAPSSSASGEFEATFDEMRSRPVPLDVLHALCRSDIVQLAALASVRSTRMAADGSNLRDDPRASFGRLSGGGEDVQGGRGGGGGGGGGLGGALAHLGSSAAAASPLGSADQLPVPSLPPALASSTDPLDESVSELLEAMLLPLRPAQTSSNPLLRASASSGGAPLDGISGLARLTEVTEHTEEDLADDDMSLAVDTVSPSSSSPMPEVLGTTPPMRGPSITVRSGSEAPTRASRMLDENVIRDHF